MIIEQSAAQQHGKPHEPRALILDTNIWLDWLVFEDPAVLPLQQAHSQGRIHLVATEAMRRELEAVLLRLRPLTPARQSAADRGLARFDTLVRLCADPHPGAASLGLVCSDHNDQMFLELLVCPAVHGLITKDKALLRLRRKAQAVHRWIGLTSHWPQVWLGGEQRRLE